ncbi:hypothetical protein [Nonlabens marinus]|nr:hypothetical protein [Nonlabens marinus]
MNRYLFITPWFLLLFACQDLGNLQAVAAVPNSLDEISGMQVFTMPSGDVSFLSINDSGNGPHLYSYIQSDQIYDQKVKGVSNIDWEDIALSLTADGTPEFVFIADTGNNNNSRKSFQIIQVHANEIGSSNSITSKTYPFIYEDMQDNLPSSGIYHDCEAIVYKEGRIYLFTKNRNKKFDGFTSIYSLDIKNEATVAKLLNKVYIGSKRSTSRVTAADINPKGEVGLLTHNKVILLNDFDESFSSFDKKIYELKHDSQKEAMAFINDSVVLIADERSKKGGGNVYKFELKASFLDVSRK